MRGAVLQVRALLLAVLQQLRQPFAGHRRFCFIASVRTSAQCMFTFDNGLEPSNIQTMVWIKRATAAAAV